MSKTVDVASVADLAQIALEPQEMDMLQGQLETIIQYLGKIGQVDASAVEPTFYGRTVVNAFREDTVTPPSATREQMLALSPERGNNSEVEFRLPKIVVDA